MGPVNLYQAEHDISVGVKVLTDTLRNFNDIVKLPLPGQLPAFGNAQALAEATRSSFHMLATSSFSRCRLLCVVFVQ